MKKISQFTVLLLIGLCVAAVVTVINLVDIYNAQPTHPDKPIASAAQPDGSLLADNSAMNVNYQALPATPGSSNPEAAMGKVYQDPVLPSAASNPRNSGRRVNSSAGVSRDTRNSPLAMENMTPSSSGLGGDHNLQTTPTLPGDHLLQTTPTLPGDHLLQTTPTLPGDHNLPTTPGAAAVAPSQN